MSGPKPFKISDLPKMEKKDLTTSDLFLVSDAVDAARNATYTSKGITFGTLSSSIATSVGKSEEVKKDVENTVKTEMTNKIEQYAPIQTWYAKGATDAPSELSVGDDVFVLSCGASA